MSRKGQIDMSVNWFLWGIGWNWLYLFVGAPIVFLLGGIPLSGIARTLNFIPVFVAPVIAIAGLWHVRSIHDPVRSRATEQLGEVASEVAQLEEPGTERFELVTDHGDSQLFLPPSKRDVTTLKIADDLMLVHDEATASLPELGWAAEDSTDEYHYDTISGVNFEPSGDGGGQFEITLADGGTEVWESDSGGEAALAEVQDRI
jgi:hypothetical protein